LWPLTKSVFWVVHASKSLQVLPQTPDLGYPRTPPPPSVFGFEFRPFRPQEYPLQGKFLATIMPTKGVNALR